MPPAWFFFLKVALAIWSLVVPYKFQDCLFCFSERYHWDFDRVYVQFVDGLANLVSKFLDFFQVIDKIVELDRTKSRALLKIPRDLTVS